MNETYVWRELKNDLNTHWFNVLSARLPLGEDDIFSIDVSYQSGRKSPSFLLEDSVKTSFGLKF